MKHHPEGTILPPFQIKI